MLTSTLADDSCIRDHAVHILVFLLALLAALTIGHPSIFVTDEWITVNQLAQLQEGHQVLISEGKYGTQDNGTVINPYFTYKNNYLAYPLFLPLISLPAAWLVSLAGPFFIFGILYLWIFLLIAIALFLNRYLPSWTYAGRWRWTTGLIIAAFVLLFINLYCYMPFPVTGRDTYPEILAISLTNILLFACMAVFIFQSFRIITADDNISFFGTVITISCSSYLFWTNFCKDHILVAFLFSAIVLLVIAFQASLRLRYLSAAFVVSGLLAWARPEVALFVCLSLCAYTLYVLALFRSLSWQPAPLIRVLLTPLWTVAGAIPFFVNNYLFTGNPLIPAWIFWKTDLPSSVSAGTSAVQALPAPASPDTIGTLIHLVVSSSNIQPGTFLTDIYGVLLNPQSGSTGVLLITPLFLIALFALPILVLSRRVSFSRTEKQFVCILGLLALGIFTAYLRNVSGMNASPGVLPDIRYLSPVYIPLDIIAVIIMAKIPGALDNPLGNVRTLLVPWILIIPPSLLFLLWDYPAPELWSDLFPPLNAAFSVGMFLLIAACLLCLVAQEFFELPPVYGRLLLLLACALPLIWQVDASFLARLYGTGLGGYSFWIPVVRVYFVGIF